jgi:hypothetical protein
MLTTPSKRFFRLTHRIWSFPEDVYKDDGWNSFFIRVHESADVIANSGVELFGFHVIVANYEEHNDYTHNCQLWRALLERFQFPEARLAIWAGHGDWDLAIDGPEFWNASKQNCMFIEQTVS